MVEVPILWPRALRIIAARFPEVSPWAGLPPGYWDRLDEVEALTRPSLTGEGAPSGFIQWPFSNPRPGRFSTEVLGAFYAAREEATAIAETVHHQAIRCREDHLLPHEFDMRVLGARIEGTCHDLRGALADAWPGLMDPGSHAVARSLATRLAARGSLGVVFSSVRDPARGDCVAAFTPGLVRTCSHLRYLTYRWTGNGVEVLFEKRPFKAR